MDIPNVVPPAPVDLGNEVPNIEPVAVIPTEAAPAEATAGTIPGVETPRRRGRRPGLPTRVRPEFANWVPTQYVKKEQPFTAFDATLDRETNVITFVARNAAGVTTTYKIRCTSING